ncbi:fibronectin type III domain-containing protein [Paenibacillus kobensis]|uniref:fibronectin type III domain-containing protein n=1 Tax=Paenibacillus kobensis TaxID=59841 RepID=UPI0013E39D2B|nr:fibronectin type III domain-containing protein [Paenibacillus kobensis]
MKKIILLLTTVILVCSSASIGYAASIPADSTPPTAPVLKFTPSGWTKQSVMVEVTNGTDSQSGVQKSQYKIGAGAWTDYSTAITISDEGVYDLSARTLDNAGNISSEATGQAKVDKTLPVTTHRVDGKLTSGWYSTDPIITLLPTDKQIGSGVDKTYYQLDGGANTQYTSPVLISVDGTHKLTYYSVDKAGNTEATKSVQVKLDKKAPVAPTITLKRDAYPWTGKGMNWSQFDADLSLSGGTDDGSGAVTMQYRIGETGDWVKYSAPIRLHYDYSNVNIYARSIDGAGNISNTVIKTFTALYLSGSSCCGIELEGASKLLLYSGSPDYTYSGINNVIWRADGGLYFDYSVRYADGTSSAAIPGSASKANIDKVDKIWDSQAPTTPVNVKLSNIRNIGATLTWTASSDNGAVAGYNVYVGGELKGFTATPKFTITGLVPNSNYSVTVRAVDDARNLSEPSAMQTFKTTGDLTGPSIPTALAVSTLSDGSLGLIWKASTDNFGIMEYRVFNGSTLAGSSTTNNFKLTNIRPNTAYQLSVQAVDVDGNISGKSAVLQFTTGSDVVPPSAPANLAATAVTDKTVDLTWAAAKDNVGVTKYVILRNGTPIGSTDKLTYKASSLSPNTSYTFTVKAEDAAGLQSLDSNSVSAKTTAAGITGLTVVPYVAGIEISWQAVSGATGYDVEINGTAVSTTATSYTKTKLVSNTSYAVRVRAKNAAGEGAWSSLVTVKTKLAIPTIGLASASKDQLTVSWAKITGATKYELEIDGTIVEVTDTKYTHTGLQPSTAHSYRVRAKSADNESDWSTALNKMTTPAKVTGVSVKATSHTTLTVSWPAVAGAAVYRVEVDGKVEDSSTNSYTKSLLMAASSHSIRVLAVNSGGEGEWSDPVTAMTLLPVPAQITAEPTSNAITLKWEAAYLATAYEVEVDGKVVSVGANLTYSHTKLASNSTHKYRVRAKNSNNLSNWSDVLSISTTIGTTTSVNAAATSSSLAISWTAVSGAASYEVEVNGAVAASPTTTSYSQSGLPANTAYIVRVRAKSSGSTGDWSSNYTFKTLLPTPTVTLGASTASQISLSWAAIAGATKYEVEADGASLGEVTTLTYAHKSLTASSSHTYRVRAKSADNASDWSAAVSKSTLPAAVTGVAVIPTSSTLAISWTAATGATGYDVEINGVSSANASTSLTKTNLPANTDYTIRVRAKNSAGSGGWSAAVTAKTLLPTPAVTAVSLSTQMTLSWAAVTGATEYEVEVDGKAVSAGASTTYAYKTLLPNTSHTYRVRAKSANNASDWTALVNKKTAPAKTVGLAATPSSSSLAISWTASDGATGYEVDINGTVTMNTTTSLTKSSLPANTSYTIKVRAKNSDGYGDWSASVTKKTLLATPTVTLGASTASQIPLSWAAIAGATKYEIEADGVSAGEVTTLTYAHNGLTASSSHTYRVRAKSADNTSDWSTSVSKSTTPSVVTGLSVIPTSSTLAISWTAATGATGYDVEINGVSSPNTTTSLTKSSLPANTDYSIRVRANNSAGSGGWSTPVTTKTLLTTPTTVTAVSLSTQMTLSWAAVTGATEYEVEVDGKAVSAGASTTYVYKSLLPNTSHTYRVRAKSANNASDWTALVNKKTAPAKTVGLAATPSSSSLAISWTQSDGATGYEVDINGTVTTNTTTSLTKSSLPANTSYTIKVRAKNSEGNGDWSAAVTTKTLLATPVLKTTPASTQNVLSWAAIAGATGYEVELDGAVVSAGTSTSYTHSGLTPSTTHTYRARAVNAANSSAWTAPVSQYTTPAVVTGVNVIPTSNDITINWTAVTGASSGYDVEIDGVVVSSAAASYVKNGLTADTDHSVRVRAKNSGGAGDWSALITKKTMMETPVVTAVSTSSQITLSWAAIAGTTKYEVEVDGVVKSNGTNITYAHTGVSPSTSHTYRVRSTNATNSSAWSTVVNKMTLPAAAAGVSAVPTSDSLAITWTAVTGATGYEVDVNGTVVPSTATSYTKSGLAANTSYTVRVRAKNSEGAGAWSTTVTARTLLVTPTVTPVATVSQITLSWPAITGATEYEIEVDGVKSSNGTSRSYVHTGLLPSSSHTYSVRAKNASNASEWTAILTQYTTPAEVTGINAIPTSTSLVITWPTVAGTTGYEVEINGTATASASANFTKNGLAANTAYVIRVRAKNNGGTGIWSAPVNVKTQLVTPAVTAVSAKDRMTLTWAAVAGATEYEVEFDGVAVSAGANTTYTASGLSPNTAHTYRVRALTAGNNSAWTPGASKYTTPVAVTGVSAVPTSSSIALTWPAVAGATGYDVEVNGAIEPVTTTSYTKSSLPVNTDYTIRVRAKNSGGEGEWSTPLASKTLLTTPTATAASASGKITLSWSGVTGATGYEVEVDGGAVIRIASTSYSHTGLAAGTLHNYRIRAINANNASEWSAIITQTAN